MSEEKLYAVKNDEGEWLSFDDTQTGIWYSNNPTLFKNKRYAEAQSMGRKAHVVELVEAPVKVVVSEDEADMLERLRKDENASPAGAIRNYFWGSVEGQNVDNKPRWSRENENRLMRAYVNGYTVEKPKLFLVKVPHTDDSYFYKIDDEYCNAGDSYHLEGMTDKKWFTLAEIEHYELTDCEKVVCADSARTTGKVTDDDD